VAAATLLQVFLPLQGQPTTRLTVLFQQSLPWYKIAGIHLGHCEGKSSMRDCNSAEVLDRHRNRGRYSIFLEIRMNVAQVEVPRGLLVSRTQRYLPVGGHLVLIIISAFLGACSPPQSQQTALPPTLRFIEQSPQDIFSLKEISRAEQQFEWTFQNSEDAEPWSLSGSETQPRTENGALALDPGSQPRIVVEREVAIESAKIDELKIEVQGLYPGGGGLRLFWKCEGREYSIEQRIMLRFRQGQGRAWKVFSFAVGSHPGWSGQITGVRLQTKVKPGKIIRIRRFTALRHVLSADRFATALQRPWKVMLQGELRSALLTLPGIPIERTLRVPEDSQLVLAFGVPESMQAAVHFLVTATREGPDAAPEVILDRRINPQNDGLSSWQEARIPLTAFVGEQVRLSLQVETDQTDPLKGLAAWGNPRVFFNSNSLQPPNIVLISIDTLRADHLSLYGYKRPTSPVIDHWGRQSGMVFETAVAAAPWTLPAHVSLLTGLGALKHGVNHPTPAPKSLDTLAEVLRQAGYTTAAVTGGSYLHPQFGLAQGFDRYRSVQANLANELNTQMALTLAWLRSESDHKPFFFFFHTYEVHDPYIAREPYLSQLADSFPNTQYPEVVVRALNPRMEDGYRLRNEFRVRNSETPLPPQALPSVVDLYDSGIAYTDNQLGVLFSELEELGLGKDTIVVLTSDHGEALGEHGLAGHGTLFDHDLLVPLIIALPKSDREPHRIRQQVSAVDLFPTLLELAGLPLPTGLDGRSLVPLFSANAERSPRVSTSYAALSNHGLSLRIQDRFKYVFHNMPWRPPSGIEELYDLKADPGEEQNVSSGSSQLESLRQNALTSLEEATGLRVQFANGSTESYRGTLKSGALHSATVKTPDLFSCCSIGRPGQLQFDLPPGEEFTLFLENVNRDKTIFSGELLQGDRKPHAFKFQLEGNRLNQPQALVLDRSGWRRVDGYADGSSQKATITFWWVGGDRSFEASPAASDEVLRDQLKALGYIN
jgi:arylsulfatase A-like enzyme